MGLAISHYHDHITRHRIFGSTRCSHPYAYGVAQTLLSDHEYHIYHVSDDINERKCFNSSYTVDHRTSLLDDDNYHMRCLATSSTICTSVIEQYIFQAIIQIKPIP